MPVAATVFLSESNGAGEVVTDNVSNCNFGGADVPNLVPATHPIVRPNAGEGRSFIKYWRLKVSAMGDAALIEVPKFWKSSGVLVTGERLSYGGSAAIAYSTPTNNVGVPSSALVPTSEPGSQNIGIGGAYSGSIVAAPTYTSGYLVVETVINSGGTTPIGPVNQKVIIFQWQES